MRGTIEEKIRYPNGELELEGVLSYPQSSEPKGLALLCPPHPHFAGDMDNNVIRCVGGKLSACSAVLRFNYRGVGESEIRLQAEQSVFDYWQEVEERRSYEGALSDVSASMRELQSQGVEGNSVVVGYSLGALLALKFGNDSNEVNRIVAVSPPWGKVDFSFLSKIRKPSLILTSVGDFLYSEEEISKVSGIVSPKIKIEILDMGDHFFRGCEDKIGSKVLNFIS